MFASHCEALQCQWGPLSVLLLLHGVNDCCHFIADLVLLLLAALLLRIITIVIVLVLDITAILYIIMIIIITVPSGLVDQR